MSSLFFDLLWRFLATGLVLTIPFGLLFVASPFLDKAPIRVQLWTLRLTLAAGLAGFLGWPRPIHDVVVQLPLAAGSFGPGTVHPSSWPTWILAAVMTGWAGGAAYALVRLVRHLAEVRDVSNRSEPRLEPDLLGTYHRAAGRIGLWTLPALRSSAIARSPLLVGLRRQAIVLPETHVGNLDERAVELVIAHELNHFKYRDALWSVLPTAAVVLTPWQPLAWWAAGRHRQLLEHASDEAVVGQCRATRARYSELLLDLASSEGLPSPRGLVAYGSVSTKAELEARLRRLFSRKHVPSAALATTAHVAVAAVAWAPVRLAIVAPPDVSASQGTARMAVYSIERVAIPETYIRGSIAGFTPAGRPVVTFRRPDRHGQTAVIHLDGTATWLRGTERQPGSVALSVQPDGHIAGVVLFPRGGGAYAAAWKPGSVDPILTGHPLGPGGWCRYAFRNRFGGTSDAQRAFVVLDGVPRNAPMPAGSDYSSELVAGNSRGDVLLVGSDQSMWQFPRASRRTFLMLASGKTVAVGHLAAASQTVGLGVNSRRGVVGWSGWPGHVRPFVWTAATGTLPLPVPAGFDQAVASSINEAGWIAGVAFGAPTAKAVPVVWRPNLTVAFVADTHPVSSTFFTLEEMDIRFEYPSVTIGDAGQVGFSRIEGDRAVPIVLWPSQ